MLTKEEYRTLVLKIHYSLSYHEADDDIFDALEQLNVLVDNYFRLKEEYKLLYNEVVEVKKK